MCTWNTVIFYRYPLEGYSPIIKKKKYLLSSIWDIMQSDLIVEKKTKYELEKKIKLDIGWMEDVTFPTVR